MNLIELLQEESRLAIKTNKQKRAFYQMLLADAQLLAKSLNQQLNDSHIKDAAAYLKKRLQPINTEQSQLELEWLKPFCYQELDEADIRNLVYELKYTQQMSLGQMMKHLTSKYAGAVDKGLAKQFYDRL